MNYIEISHISEILKKVNVEKPNEDRIKIDRYNIIKSVHQSENRNSNLYPRDFGISDKEFRRILSLAIYNNELKSGTYHLLYKPNSKGELYNDIVVRVNKNIIKIITIMQMQRLVSEYKIYKGDQKLVLEKLINYIII